MVHVDYGAGGRSSEEMGAAVTAPDRSEADSDCQLYDTRAAIRRGFAEQSVSLLSRCVKLRGCVDSRPLHVVESVVEFTANLNCCLLTDHEVFESGQIPLVLPGASKHVPRRVADITQRRERED